MKLGTEQVCTALFGDMARESEALAEHRDCVGGDRPLGGGDIAALSEGSQLVEWVILAANKSQLGEHLRRYLKTFLAR